MEMTEKKIVRVCLTGEQYAALTALARDSCRTPAAYLRQLLVLHLRRGEKI